MDKIKFLILGAGPTGLGAAWRLNELGEKSCALLEGSSQPGGLSKSYVDEQGFTWDLGGHVLFSHYKYFDELMDKLLPGQWIEHVRESWVWMRNRFIPYPLQNNIRNLPTLEFAKCLAGLAKAKYFKAAPPKTFEDWILQKMGQGLFKSFMEPYNFKVWAYPPRELSTSWMGERVATIDLAKILKNFALRRDDISWGPNSKFRFPLKGGTGSIWNSLYEKLPRDQIHLNSKVIRIDPIEKKAFLQNGQIFNYEFLITSIPLSQLVVLIDRPEIKALPSDFVYSHSNIIGIGLEGRCPNHLASRNWIYFPEDNCPFYRVTVFSNYSPHNVPDPKNNWSLLCEVAESPRKPVYHDKIFEDVIQGLKSVKFLHESSKIVSRWKMRLEHGYPTPFLNRDSILAPLDQTLKSWNIFSRGRFGGWKYEVSNQDHSLMQGVEAVNHILKGTPENTYYNPNLVNSNYQT